MTADSKTGQARKVESFEEAPQAGARMWLRLIHTGEAGGLSGPDDRRRGIGRGAPSSFGRE